MKRIILITILSIIFLIPYYWMIVISLEPDSKGTNPVFHLIPQRMTFDNYIFLFVKVKNFYKWVFNSLFISICDVFLTCFSASLAAYIIVRKIPFVDKIFMIMLVSMAIPGNILLLPRYILMKDLNLINTYISMYIMIGAGGVFLIKQVIQTIPTSLIEAAKIDGASEWQIYGKVIIPLIKPSLICLGLFTFIGTYNNYFWQLLMISTPNMKTLPLVVASFAGEDDPKMQLTMAAAVVASLPLLILFFIFHKHFIKGIRVGSVKG